MQEFWNKHVTPNLEKLPSQVEKVKNTLAEYVPSKEELKAHIAKIPEREVIKENVQGYVVEPLQKGWNKHVSPNLEYLVEQIPSTAEKLKDTLAQYVPSKEELKAHIAKLPEKEEIKEKMQGYVVEPLQEGWKKHVSPNLEQLPSKAKQLTDTLAQYVPSKEELKTKLPGQEEIKEKVQGYVIEPLQEGWNKHVSPNLGKTETLSAKAEKIIDTMAQYVPSNEELRAKLPEREVVKEKMQVYVVDPLFKYSSLAFKTALDYLPEKQDLQGYVDKLPSQKEVKEKAREYHDKYVYPASLYMLGQGEKLGAGIQNYSGYLAERLREREAESKKSGNYRRRPFDIDFALKRNYGNQKQLIDEYYKSKGPTGSM